MVKALVVVAHPDDETIWMGGTILKNKNWDWTIISLCRKHDKDRAPKFKKVCKLYKAKAIMSDYEDEKLNSLSTTKTIKDIKEVLPKTNYDRIYTHGKNGEYGHKRHKEIHRAMKKMLATNQLKCKQILYFSYEPKGERVQNQPGLRVAIPRRRADTRVKLGGDNFKKKRKLIIDEYKFKDNSFEALSCNEVEAFDKK